MTRDGLVEVRVSFDGVGLAGQLGYRDVLRASERLREAAVEAQRAQERRNSEKFAGAPSRIPSP